MKKSHLLWKVLVVVMIISAMMAMLIACDKEHDCETDGHVDEDGNYVCDVCGAVIDTTGNWNVVIGMLDDAIANLRAGGDVATMGGEAFAEVTVKSGDGDPTTVRLALDFGLELLNEVDADILENGSNNAFGFTLDVDGVTYLGLWYVDNGTSADNFVYAQFGDLANGGQAFRFNAPSLAQTFDTFPVTVNENIANEIAAGAASGAIGGYVPMIGQLLPAIEIENTATRKAYEIRLTDFLFNTVGISAENDIVGSMIAGLLTGTPAITSALSALGIVVDTADPINTLDSIIPPISLTIAANYEGTTMSSIEIGANIAGQKMSIPVTTDTEGDALLSSESGEIVITEGFDDIDFDLEVGFLLGDNSQGAYKTTVDNAIPAAVKEGKNISLINVALETEIVLGYGKDVEPTTYNLELAADIDPSYLTKVPFIVTAYAVNSEGAGYFVDKDNDGVYDAGEESTVPAVNFNFTDTSKANALDAILGMVNSLYINLDGGGDANNIKLYLTDKTIDATTGKVTNFTVNFAQMQGLTTLLNTFGVQLEGAIADLVGGLNGSVNLVNNAVVSTALRTILSGLVSGVSYDMPTEWVEQTTDDGNADAGNADSGNTDSNADSDSSFDIGEILSYFDFFNIVMGENSINISTVANTVIKDAGIDFDATAELLKAADGTVNGVKLSLDGPLTVNGSDDVDTTITLDKPLQIGGNNNIFSAQVTASVVDNRKVLTTEVTSDCPSGLYIDLNGNGKFDIGEQVDGNWNKSMNLTIGLNVLNIAYGTAPTTAGDAAHYANLFDTTNGGYATNVNVTPWA